MLIQPPAFPTGSRGARRRARAGALVLAAATCVAALASVAGAQEAPATDADGRRAMQLADWYRVTTVSQPAMSPDGRLVAFTVTTVREAENARHREVWVVPTDGGEPTRWTAPGTESSNPRWTPDGAYLLFSSRRDGGRGSTWALRVRGPSGEAEQLETLPEGSVPRSGAFAVFTGPAERDSADEAGEADAPDRFAKMPGPARPPFGAITRPAVPARFDGRHYVDTPIKRNGPGYVANPRTAPEDRPQQLWRQAFGDTARTMITDAPYSHRGAVVSPDGTRIAFVADAALRPDSVVRRERDSLALLPFDPVRDTAVENDVDVYVVPVGGGAPRKVAEWAGNESQLTWSPDGRRLAFTGAQGRTGQTHLYVVDAAGGTPLRLTEGFRYEPQGVTWLPDGTLHFTAAVGGASGVFRADPSGRAAPTAVLGGRRRVSGTSYDREGRTVAFVSTRIAEPTELFVADADGTNERKLTGFNDALNAEVAWSDAERFTYEGVGGLEIEGWLMKPFGYREGERYPLVLYIHGGPHSSYGERWFDEFQNLAAEGMFVLFTNPRGSRGYGADFTFSTRGRWFAEDYDDLMRAVDIVAQREDVDSTRMGVTGGSYGGVMTAWVTAKTDRFKAAQADRMISNWWSWYGSSDAQGLTNFEFYGTPWDNPAMYDTLSPIRYADQVKTPTLIVQSEEDHRTPMTDAEQWFVALKRFGVPVEFVRYPRSTHDLSRTGEPWLLVDRLGRLRDWFNHYLKPAETAAP